MNATANTHEESFQPLPAVLAFLLPGLGHVALGHTRRGILIGVSILTLFLSGILIGGIDVIDRREDKWWFLGQACAGPVAFAADAYHQSLKVRDPVTNSLRAPNPDEHPRFEKSLGRVNEIGALFATIAGLLNLIALIDAAWHTPRPSTRGRPRVRPAAA